MLDGDTRHSVALVRDGSGQTLAIGDTVMAARWVDRPGEVAGVHHIDLTLGSARIAGTIVIQGEKLQVFEDGNGTALVLHDLLAHAGDDDVEHAGGLTAPMPGKIIAVHVKAGDKVKRGQALLVMEAMKMEHTISAPAAGLVKEVFFAVGDQVTDGASLISVE